MKNRTPKTLHFPSKTI